MEPKLDGPGALSPSGGAGDDIVLAPKDPVVAEFAAFWRARCRDGLLPSRASFGIPDLYPWIGRIMIMDVIDGGRDFRYRLIGTVLVDAVGRDLTGRLVSEGDYAGNRANVMDSFRRPLVTRAPVFRRGNVVWRADRDWRHYESVHCPLANDGETVDMTIGVQVYLATTG